MVSGANWIKGGRERLREWGWGGRWWRGRERDVVEREGGDGEREGGRRWRERERETCAMTMMFLPPTLIAEVIMYWEGFESSKKLVQKMRQK